jgi:glycosyltransferase involved in cell wall biosynthesis
VRCCLCLIVRNESHVIERCLSSVRPFIDTWVVVDTGSVDKTKDIILDFLGDIPGTLLSTNWEGFSKARNFALAQAKGKADHILFVDADDYYVQNTANSNFSFGQDVTYVWAYDKRGIRHRRVAAVADHVLASWVGDIHEYLCFPSDLVTITTESHHLLYSHEGARSSDNTTARKDEVHLRRALKQNPDDARAQFYLGLTAHRRGARSVARTWYRRRSRNYCGEEEERWYAEFQLAKLVFRRSERTYCVEAAHMLAVVIKQRPTRAEPCIALARALRLLERYEEAIEVARYAAALNIPDDSIFVEPGSYGWQAYEEMALSQALGFMAYEASSLSIQTAIAAAQSARYCSSDELKRLNKIQKRIYLLARATRA